MELIYEILYKNGKEDIITQEINEETGPQLQEINETIEYSMKEDVAAVVTFGNGVGGGHYIRVSDISRVRISVQEGKE